MVYCNCVGYIVIAPLQLQNFKSRSTGRPRLAGDDVGVSTRRGRVAGALRRIVSRHRHLQQGPHELSRLPFWYVSRDKPIRPKHSCFHFILSDPILNGEL